MSVTEGTWRGLRGAVGGLSASGRAARRFPRALEGHGTCPMHTGWDGRAHRDTSWLCPRLCVPSAVRSWASLQSSVFASVKWVYVGAGDRLSRVCSHMSPHVMCQALGRATPQFSEEKNQDPQRSHPYPNPHGHVQLKFQGEEVPEQALPAVCP